VIAERQGQRVEPQPEREERRGGGREVTVERRKGREAIAERPGQRVESRKVRA
jgi:hypothetical protein